jgi:hypothetical protein
VEAVPLKPHALKKMCTATSFFIWFSLVAVVQKFYCVYGVNETACTVHPVSMTQHAPVHPVSMTTAFTVNPISMTPHAFFKKIQFIREFLSNISAKSKRRSQSIPYLSVHGFGKG